MGRLVMTQGLVGACLVAAAVAGAPKHKASKSDVVRVWRTGTNKPFVIGDVRYVVREVTRRDSLTVGGLPELPPQGAKFVTVWHTAENTGLNPAMVKANWFYLRDNKGRRFTMSDRLQALLAMVGFRDGTEVNFGSVELEPGVKRSLITGFVLPDDAIDGAGLRLYFPADGVSYDFIEVWPSDQQVEQAVTESR